MAQEAKSSPNRLVQRTARRLQEVLAEELSASVNYTQALRIFEKLEVEVTKRRDAFGRALPPAPGQDLVHGFHSWTATPSLYFYQEPGRGALAYSKLFLEASLSPELPLAIYSLEAFSLLGRERQGSSKKELLAELKVHYERVVAGTRCAAGEELLAFPYFDSLVAQCTPQEREALFLYLEALLTTGSFLGYRVFLQSYKPLSHWVQEGCLSEGVFAAQLFPGEEHGRALYYWPRGAACPSAEVPSEDLLLRAAPKQEGQQAEGGSALLLGTTKGGSDLFHDWRRDGHLLITTQGVSLPADYFELLLATRENGSQVHFFSPALVMEEAAPAGNSTARPVVALPSTVKDLVALLEERQEHGWAWPLPLGSRESSARKRDAVQVLALNDCARLFRGMGVTAFVNLSQALYRLELEGPAQGIFLLMVSEQEEATLFSEQGALLRRHLTLRPQGKDFTALYGGVSGQGVTVHLGARPSPQSLPGAAQGEASPTSSPKTHSASQLLLGQEVKVSRISVVHDWRSNGHLLMTTPRELASEGGLLPFLLSHSSGQAFYHFFSAWVPGSRPQAPGEGTQYPLFLLSSVSEGLVRLLEARQAAGWRWPSSPGGVFAVEDEGVQVLALQQGERLFQGMPPQAWAGVMANLRRLEEEGPAQGIFLLVEQEEESPSSLLAGDARAPRSALMATGKDPLGVRLGVYTPQRGKETRLRFLLPSSREAL